MGPWPKETPGRERHTETPVSRGAFASGDVIFAALVSLYAIVIVPLSVFRLYRQEFAASFWDVGAYFLAAGALVFAALAILLRLVPRHLRGWIARALLVVVVLTWYDLNFLDYRGKLVGVDADVVRGRYTAYELIGFLAVGAAVFAARTLSRHLVTIMALVCAVGTIGLASEGAGRRGLVPAPLVFPDHLYSYSADSNVLHVVLDGMQSVFLQDLIDRDPGAAERLDGFWYFPDTLTSSEVTYLSFRAFLTGTPFTGEGLISEYMALPRPTRTSRPAAPPDLFAALRDTGFDLDLLSGGSNGLTSNLGYRSFVLSDLSNASTVEAEVLKVTDYTLLRALPWSLKPLVYQNGALYFSSLGRRSRAFHAFEFLESYASRITTASPRATYKLIHLMIPHGPWTLGSSCEDRTARALENGAVDQGRCALEAVVQLVEALSELSIYDRTAILIHGDHGSCLETGLPAAAENIPPCVGNTNPLLMLKPLNSRGRLQVSNRSAALTDIPATIGAVVGLPTTAEGQSLIAGNDSAVRERTFYAFQPDRLTAWRRDRVEVILKYTVAGNVRDSRAWSREVVRTTTPD